MSTYDLLLCAGPSSSDAIGMPGVGIPGMQTTLGATQMPPPGFIGNPHDVVPTPFRCPETLCKQDYTLPLPSGSRSHNNSRGNTTQVFLFNIERDPTESVNLAPTEPELLAQMIAAFEEYQKTAVDDLSILHGIVDPASNPLLREDKTCE